MLFCDWVISILSSILEDIYSVTKTRQVVFTKAVTHRIGNKINYIELKNSSH